MIGTRLQTTAMFHYFCLDDWLRQIICCAQSIVTSTFDRFAISCARYIARSGDRRLIRKFCCASCLLDICTELPARDGCSKKSDTTWHTGGSRAWVLISRSRTTRRFPRIGMADFATHRSFAISSRALSRNALTSDLCKANAFQSTVPPSLQTLAVRAAFLVRRYPKPPKCRARYANIWPKSKLRIPCNQRRPRRSPKTQRYRRAIPTRHGQRRGCSGSIELLR
jgi:hypothetical protein